MQSEPVSGWWTTARTALVVAGGIGYAVFNWYCRFRPTGTVLRVPTVVIQSHSMCDWLGIGILGLILALFWGVTIWGAAGLFSDAATDKGLVVMTTVFALGLSVGLTLLFWPMLGIEVIL